MVEVMITARDAAGNALAFTMGMGRDVVSAKLAAKVGMNARLRSERGLNAKVRTFETEVL